ncbi:uncharacterized protein LOC119731718 [Patiria miniata]|uniref:Sfi1 spindle body domain-containing protein n=1 Tax=Patiria miniata TaxID=46514 RepID=A0A914AAI1_PATMI|nr:uncharacterized protein LOC119731718 [Patiria miniata]
MDRRPLEKHRHSKSSRRALFKENMSPRLKTSGRRKTALYQTKELCHTTLHEVQENVHLQPAGKRQSSASNCVRDNTLGASRIMNLATRGTETTLCAVDVNGRARHRGTRTSDSVQDNVMFGSQHQTTKNCSAKESGISLKESEYVYIPDHVNRLTSVNNHLIEDDPRSRSKVQDNVVYDKTFATCPDDKVTGIDVCGLSATVPLLDGTGRNWFEADLSRLMIQQSDQIVRIQEKQQPSVQDNVVCNLALSVRDGSGSEPSNSVLSQELEETEELGENQNQREPVGSGSDQLCSAEESDMMFAGDTFDGRHEDAEIQEHPKTPEEWLVEPLQRLSLGINNDQSECLQNTKGIMGTHRPLVYMSDLPDTSHTPAQTPSQHPEQCLASVQRVEELIIHSPVPPSDVPYYSTSSYNRQIIYDQPFDNHDHFIDGSYRQATNPAYSRHNQSNFQQEFIIHATRDVQSFSSCKDYPDDNDGSDQHWSDTCITPSKQPSGLGSVPDVNLDALLQQPEYPSEDLNGRWYAPDSNGWIEVQSHRPTSLYSQLTNPSKLLGVTPIPQQNLDMYWTEAAGLDNQEFIAYQTDMEHHRAIESDKNQSTSRPARTSNIRIGNTSLPFTGTPSHVTSSYSSESFLHHQPRSSGSSDVSQPLDFDLRELDQFDDADLYRFSETDDFVHSKPVDGLYARSTPAKLDKNGVSRASEKSGKSRSRKKLDEEKETEKQDEDKDLCELRTGEGPTNNWNNNNIAVFDNGLQTRLTSSMKMVSKSSDDARTDQWKDSKVSSSPTAVTSPSTVTVNAAVLHTKLQCSLESGALNLASLIKESSISDQLIFPRYDPASDTKMSPLRHSYPSSPGQALTLDDLKLSISPNDLRLERAPSFRRTRADNTAQFSAVSVRHRDKNRSPSYEYANRRSVPSTRTHRTSEATGFIRSRNFVDRSSHQTQSGNTGRTQQRTKNNVKHLNGVPKPQKSAGFPKKSCTPVTASKSLSPLALSSSHSPRQTFSILWAFKILDILHSASPDKHEELVTKLYWFRRWHKNVRLIKTRQEEREEQRDRATSHYKIQLMTRCLQAWKLAPPCHKRAADKLRETHLLKKALHGLRWAVMQSSLEMEGAVSRCEKFVKRRHFGTWRDLYQVRTERAQLLEKLAAKHSIAVTFQTWKDRYNLAQKDGIARLHYKVSLLSQGFQCWKLFTSQSKVKGYRGEMSRVHHEEKIVQKAWHVMRAVYTQTQRANSHYSQKLLSAVIHTWVRGSQLAKAERHQQHSQALELRRRGLLRAHFKRWKEELLVMQVKQRLDRVRKRYVWELWTLRLQRQQLYRQIMESQARKVAKQRVFSKWMQVARQQKEAARRASVILRQMYLKIVFQRWRSYVNRERKLRSTLSTAISNTSLRTKQCTLLTWSTRLRVHQARQAAHRAWSLKCVMRAVSKWKERVRHRRLEDRLVQFQPVHDQHVKRDAFKRWTHEHRLALQDHQRALSARHKLFRNRILRFLLSWRLLAKESKTIAPLLERRDWKHLASSFDAWRERVLRKKACKQYRSLRSSRYLEKSFMTWREQTASRQKVRSVLDSLLTSKLTRAFLGWREVIQRKVNLKVFLKRRQDTTVRGIFDCWRKASEEEMLTREVEQGDKAREVLLATVFFSMWSKNARQQRETEDSLIGDHGMRWCTRKIRAAYQQWRRQLLVQNIARNAQADREASLMHRVFQAWHQETKSTYQQLTERFHMAFDVMSMSFPNDSVSPKSALSAPTLDLQQSLSSSSGGSQGLPAHLSTADSGYGNGMGLPLIESHQSHQDASQCQQDILQDDGRSRDKQEENSQTGNRQDQLLPFQGSRVSRVRGASGLRLRVAVSSDDDMYPEELPQTVGSPRFKDSRHPLKPQSQPLLPSSMRSGATPQPNGGLHSPRGSRATSFLRRRASLDQNLPSSQVNHRMSSASRMPGARWGGTRSASVDQGLLSSPAVINHLRNIHRKSQTENPMLFSTEEEPEVAFNSVELGSPPSESLIFSQPQSPDSHNLQASTYHNGVPIPLDTSPRSHSPPQPWSSPSHTPLSSSPRSSFSPNLSKSLLPLSPRHHLSPTLSERKSQTIPDSHHSHLSNLISPLSPRSLTFRRLSEGQSQTISDSRRSSVSDSSSTGPESTRSSSYYMQLVGYDLESRSRTASEYAPSVFSDGAPPVSPPVDQKTYLRSLILHWRLWPASAAFNQWLDYARRRRDLRELAERTDNLFRQIRLHRALMTWQRRCHVERLARNHWEMKSKLVHLNTWIQYSRNYQRYTRQRTEAEDMASNNRLNSAFHIWKTKHKKHKAVLSIVHNWKGYVQQTVNLEDRTKDLRHQIQRRSTQECFRSWKVRTWQLLEVKAHHNRVITTRCLITWASWTKERTIRKEKLQSFKTKRLKQLVLHRWQSQRIKLQAAKAFYRQAVVAHLREIVRRWSMYVSKKHEREAAAARMIQERDERSVHKMWTTWKHQKQQTERIKQLYLTNVARKHLLAWHSHSSHLQTLNFTSAVIKKQRNSHLKHSVLQAWQRAYRASQLARQIQARLRKKQLSKALWDWRRYTQRCRSEKYNQQRLLRWALCTWQSHCAKQKSTKLSVLRMVHHWRKRTQQSKDLVQSLTLYQTHHDTMKRQKTFEFWKLAWQQHRKAAGHRNHVILERCVSGWHTFATVQRQRQTALLLWQKNKCKKVVAASFQKWKQDHLYCKDLETRLAVFYQQRAAEMLARVIQAWHHETMEGLAVRRHNTVVQNKAWQRWRKSFTDTQVATRMTEDKQTQVNTAVFNALLDWCRARKSQKASYHLVTTHHRSHTIQAAFTFWKTEALQKCKASTHANQVLQSKVVRGWSIAVQRTIALQVLSGTTQRTCNTLRQQSALRVWMHQLQRTVVLKGCLEGALQRRDQAMLRLSFTQWRQEAMARRAARHRASQTLKWGWSVWRLRVTDRQYEEDMDELADEHYNQHISKKVLGLWLTEAKIGRLERKRSNRLAKKYGLVWKNGCKIAHTAVTMDMYWSIQRAWVIWRRGMIQSLMSKTMQQYSERQLREQSFKAWRKQATPANNGLRRDLLNRRLYTAFRVWRERTQAVVDQSLGDKSRSSSISNQSSSAGYTSSSGASELAGIWMNAQRTGSGYGEGGNQGL